MKTTGRVLLVLCLLTTALAVTVAPAAAAPANDTEATAAEVAGVPFTESLDTREATPDGPRFCSNAASVFYRFTPAADVSVQVDTLGSEYDTTLGVYTRTADGRVRALGCNDDRIGWASGLRLHLKAGTTYFFMVGRCCSSRRHGGPLVFRVGDVVSEPLATTFEVDDLATIDPGSGIVTITATVTCNKPSFVYSEGTLRQVRQQIFLARGYWYASLACSPDAPAVWSFEVDTDTSVLFGSGEGLARRFYVEGYAGWREWAGDYETAKFAVTIV